jgi:hypothetical protein
MSKRTSTRADGMSPSLSVAAAERLGTQDGLHAGQSIALVLLARYSPALFGAVTLLAAGMSDIPADDFYEAVAADAYGADWPWPDDSDYDYKPWSAYLQTFGQSVNASLRSEATTRGAVRDLTAKMASGEMDPSEQPEFFRWIAALDRLGQREWAEEQRLVAERLSELKRHKPAAWILPAPRSFGLFERGRATKLFSVSVDSGNGGHTARVARRESGRGIYRETFSSRPEAERAGNAFLSIRWQIACLPHLQGLDHTLFTREFFEEPFGRDGPDELLRIADRVDRSARGYELGEYSDAASWEQVRNRDVAGLLARLPVLPFGWSRPLRESNTDAETTFLGGA